MVIIGESLLNIEVFAEYNFDNYLNISTFAKTNYRLLPCDFIRCYNNGKRQNGGIYQLMDFFSMFHFRYGLRRVTDEHFWRNHLGTLAVQIDMIIDRADGIVTVCEMKYSKDDYRLTEAEYRKIVRRMEVFSNETGHKGGVQATVVTTYALKDNMYSEISPVAITMNELFEG